MTCTNESCRTIASFPISSLVGRFFGKKKSSTHQRVSRVCCSLYRIIEFGFHFSLNICSETQKINCPLKEQLYTPTPEGTSVIWQPSSNTHPSPAPAHFPVSTFSFLPTLMVGLTQRTMTILQMLREGRSAHDGMMVASETLCENGPQGFIFKLLPLEHLS